MTWRDLEQQNTPARLLVFTRFPYLKGWSGEENVIVYSFMLSAKFRAPSQKLYVVYAVYE